MNEATLEALVPRLQVSYLRLQIAKEQETLTSEKGLSIRKNMLSMHERRKGARSTSVIWYIVSFRQFRTDRPLYFFRLLYRFPAALVNWGGTCAFVNGLFAC